MPKENNPRLILAKLRRGDFAHAGDRDAIDIVLKKISELIELNRSKLEPLDILDVGSGLGGTADYIRQRIPCRIFGVDVDNAAIKYSKTHYHKVSFFESDVINIDKLFDSKQFDVIYMFNVFYALPYKKMALYNLAKIAKKDCILAIFDYSLMQKEDLNLRDLSNKEINPIYIPDLKVWLKETGWDLIEVVDLNVKYQNWYADFLKTLSANKEEILSAFTEEAFSKVYDTFSKLLDRINKQKMGGSVIYARKNRLKDQAAEKRSDTIIKCKL